MVKKENKFPKKILLASPRGFCAGVKRAIDLIDLVCQKNQGKEIYCYHQIVHNLTVVSRFEKKGVIFVDNLNAVPKGSILIFSSHGISPAIKLQASNLHLQTIDATCPFVSKTHLEVKNFAKNNYHIIYLGQKNHDEAVGTVGEAPNNISVIQNLEEIEDLSFSKKQRLSLVTQTTLSFDETQNLKKELKKRFPQIEEPPQDDICKATQNRQNGVKKLVKLGAEVIIVLGSPNSSNSNRLKSVAEKMGAKAYLLDQITDLDPQLLSDINCVGLTAGASLPEEKIVEAITWFQQKKTRIKEIKIAEENLNLALPEINL
ncbi:MAG: 4-hydroxy-3-methylbut-2-enyl diphosphate reductase [Candidatus Daviesbacteria bacterium]|nr:4-hydroxy-3-methylbut-2-enyl diphosphate reductase [Candidatus Daviesbacteria bacterium]